MIDVYLPAEAILEICQPGSNDEVVKKWCEKLGFYSLVDLSEAFQVVRDCHDASLNEKRDMTIKQVIEFAIWNLAWTISDSSV